MMKYPTICTICGSETTLAAHAIIAPFISVLCEIPIGERSELRHCTGCDFLFYARGFTSDELSRLYSDYRGLRYTNYRKSWEPWYSDSVNEAFAPGSAAVERRRRFMHETLAGGNAIRPYACAIDYGGDQGQFFPDVPIGERHVYDVSTKELPSGVNRIKTVSELAGKFPDLVICAHVLEHLTDPLKSLREIGTLIDPAGVLYVEVPLDCPKLSRNHSSTMYARWLQLLTKSRIGLIFIDFVSGVSRQFLGLIPPIGVVKQSEHINYYSERALQRLLEEAGFRVTSRKIDSKTKAGSYRFGTLGMTAIKASS